MFKRYWTM